MDEATATSLGAKLGELDLTEDEALLLGVALGGRPADPDEVEGFAAAFTEVEIHVVPIVRGIVADKWDAHYSSFERLDWTQANKGISQTYGGTL